MEEETKKTTHPIWKIKFFVGTVMLALAFIGMIFMILKSDGAWIYWRIMTPVFALLCIGLSFYLRHKNIKTMSTIWHEILHWSGLLGSILLVTLLVPALISRFIASIVVMILLALATFLAGVYTEATFMLIGLVMALLVVGMTFIGYLFIPIIVAAVVLLFWLSRRVKEE